MSARRGGSQRGTGRRSRGPDKATGRRARGSRGPLLYVYALAQTTRTSLVVGRDRIEFVGFGAIVAAVVRRSTSPRLSERALRAQHRVVCRLFDVTDAILPVRFGALVERDELSRVIQLRGGPLLSALRRVRGQVQMTVRIFGSVSGRGVEAQRTPRSGADYLRARAAASRPAPSPAGDRVSGAVRSLVSDERLDPGQGAVQVTIHHLVRRDRLDEYRSRVDDVVAGRDSRAHIVVSGPWPPFAFAPDLWE